MKKICILTGSHLSRNPRVVKEATALLELGHSVNILSIWTNKSLLNVDLTLIDPTIRYEGIDLLNWNSWTVIIARGKRRFFQELQKRLGLESVHSLGYSLLELFRKAKAKQADLYICHQEVGLVVGCWLMKAGHKVAFDLEDWYSKDLLPEAQKDRPLSSLEKMEKRALDHGCFILTTSGALSEAMSNFYQSIRPHVLRNVFPLSYNYDSPFLDKNESKQEQEILSLYWFSQTVGPGRGIEELINAVNTLNDVPLNIHLRGNVTLSYQQNLDDLIEDKQKHRLFFHPLITPQELERENQKYDVGLALEHKFPPSRNYTLTNKMMQYIAGGLAIVASDTEGQLEAARHADGAVQIIDLSRPASIAQAIRFYANPQNLVSAKKKAKAAYLEEFNWDLEKEKLKKLVAQQFNPS